MTKKKGIIKVDDLDDLVDRDFKSVGLTPGEVARVLQISPFNVIRLCRAKSSLYEGFWLENQRTKGGFRRIKIDGFVNSLKKRWDDFKKPYPQRQLHHFMEIAGLNPEDYGLKGLAGEGGLRFHTLERTYTTCEVADLIRISQLTVTRCFDRGIFEGYKLPNSKFRRIPAGVVAGYIRDKRVPLKDGVEIESSPEIVTYSDPYLGYEKGKRWKDGTKVAEDNGGQSVWYRCLDRVYEVSIRQGEDYGLYIKLVGIEESNPRIDMILLGKANRNSEEGILPKKEHLERVKRLSEQGKYLLDEFSYRDFASTIEEKVHKALQVVSKSQERFENVYMKKR